MSLLRLLVAVMVSLPMLRVSVPRALAQPAGATRGERMAWGVVDDVVRVSTTLADGSAGEEGFGFVFGLTDGKLFVATADHVVRGQGDDAATPSRVEVRFYGDQGHPYQAELLDLRLPQQRGDLTVLQLPRPASFTPSWPVVADADALRPGTRAWRIGKLEHWVPAAAPGVFISRGATWLLFDGLDAPRGSSGGPIVTEAGIVGMVVADGGSSGASSNVLPISTIRGVLLSWKLPWDLRTVELAARRAEGPTSAPPSPAPITPAAPSPPPPASPSLAFAAPPTFTLPNGPDAPLNRPSQPFRDADGELALDLTLDDRIAVQRGLGALGFPAGREDGEFGPQTRDAIRALQARAGLPATGYLDGQLRQRILRESARATPAVTVPALPSRRTAAVQSFVLRYYAESSQPNALQYLRFALADRVMFFGHEQTRDQVIAQQSTIFNRWPVHTLTARPDSVTVDCDDANRFCRAAGVVDYEMRSQQRGAVSTGSERFMMDIDLASGMRIVGLRGVGLQRSTAALEGGVERWTTQGATGCMWHYFDWRQTDTLFEFTDEAGQIDVERVLDRGAGVATTETLRSQHQARGSAPGTRWSYVFDPHGQVFVRNLTDGTTFTLTRCTAP